MADQTKLLNQSRFHYMAVLVEFKY